MAQPSIHGRFIWQELLAGDTTAAENFYSEIIGWRVEAPSHAGGQYSIFVADSGPVSGVMPLPEEARQMGARPHWLPYIGAEDVDYTLANIEKLGGKVLRPATDIENLGRYAVLADPQGAAFGIYRPLHPPASATSPPKHGEFSWLELASSDHDAAFEFYSELFGWEALHRMDMGPAGTYLVFGRDGVQQGGIYKLSAQMPAPYWLPYIEVEDVDALVEQVRAAGGRVVNGPMEVPGGGRIAQLLDPGEVLFAVHQPAKAAASGAAVSGAPPPAKRTAKRSSARPTAEADHAAASLPAATPEPAVAPAKQGASAPPAAKKAVKKAAKKAPESAAQTAGKPAAEPPRAAPAAKKASKRPAKRVISKRPARNATAKRPAKTAKTAKTAKAAKTAKRPARASGRPAHRGKGAGKATRARAKSAGRGRSAPRRRVRGRSSRRR